MRVLLVLVLFFITFSSRGAEDNKGNSKPLAKVYKRKNSKIMKELRFVTSKTIRLC